MKTANQLASNRRYMARRRACPETNAILKESAKKCWENGANIRQREYLNRLKERDFFKWKARRSYIMLTADELRELWEDQNGKCALTGRVLKKDAEIDHILPISKGGDNSMSNSRWVCREANQAKHAMTDEDFFILVKLITESKAYTEWIGRRIMEAIDAGNTA